MCNFALGLKRTNPMRKFCFIIIFAMATIFTAVADEISEEYFAANYERAEAMIPMRDGIKLFTAVFTPKNATEKRPIIMLRSPYGNAVSEGFDCNMFREYIRNKYIIVLQSVRGLNGSEGTFDHCRAFIAKKKRKQTDESTDAYDTIDWLIRNVRNNNGNVGIIGMSYPGFYASNAMLCNHPALKAVSPQAPVTDWFTGDDVHRNGCLAIMDNFGFMYWFSHLNNAEVNGNKDFRWDLVKDPTKIVHNDVYTDYLRMGAVRNFTKLLGDSCPMWNEIVAHPDMDEWWQSRNITQHFVQGIRPAVLVTAGLYDAEDCHGAFTTYKAIRDLSPNTELYLAAGPWSHGQWAWQNAPNFGDIYYGDNIKADFYQKQIEYPFFAFYLEGKGVKPVNKTNIFRTGINQWEHSPNVWRESNEAEYFYLCANSLLFDRPDNSVYTARYVSDPTHPVPYIGVAPHKGRIAEYMNADQRFAASRTDVATFCSDVLTDTLRMNGSITAHLYVKTTSTDADFIVKVIDVFPDGFEYSDSLKIQSNTSMGGYQMLIRFGAMRGKYRHSLSKPEPMTPNKMEEIIINLDDVAHTLLPGHRLMVQVQSSMFPLLDRNPQQFTDIYTCDDHDFKKAEITILAGSYITIPK